MAIHAANLLKQLEPPVRPGAGSTGARTVPASIDAQSFDQLLSAAANGDFRSGRQIELRIDPNPPLQPSQLERLASAADQAEAAGAKRAMMLIDGRAFVLDVSSRALVAEVSDRATRIEKVDAAVVVPLNEGDHGGSLAFPGEGRIPPAIAKILNHSVT